MNYNFFEKRTSITFICSCSLVLKASTCPSTWGMAKLKQNNLYASAYGLRGLALD